MNAARPGGFRRRLKGYFLKRMRHMITCKEFEDFLISYLEDELPAKQRSIFEWHLGLCRECREYLAAYRRTMEIAEAVMSESGASIPEDVPEDLIKAILDARES